MSVYGGFTLDNTKIPLTGNLAGLYLPLCQQALTFNPNQDVIVSGSFVTSPRGDNGYIFQNEYYSSCAIVASPNPISPLPLQEPDPNWTWLTPQDAGDAWYADQVHTNPYFQHNRVGMISGLNGTTYLAMIAWACSIGCAPTDYIATCYHQFQTKWG